MDASVVLGIVNIGLTAVLFSLYRHIYSQTRAVFSLGLLAFAGAFALQNVLVVYLVPRHNAADTGLAFPLPLRDRNLRGDWTGRHFLDVSPLLSATGRPLVGAPAAKRDRLTEGAAPALSTPGGT